MVTTRARRWVPGLVLLLTGCTAGDGHVAVHPVRGQVIYDERPAGGVKVFFVPVDAPAPPTVPTNPHAVTKADGSFELTTFADGDGAAEGGYAVALIWPGELKEGEEAVEDDRFLGWYSPANTRLEVRVKSGTNTLPAFKLPPRTERATSGSSGVPGRN